MIIALLAFLLQPAHACKCDSQVVQALIKSPDQAHFKWVARVLEASGKAYKTENWAWGQTPPTQIVRTGSKCDLALKVGETYLILATKSDDGKFDVCNSIARPLGTSEKTLEDLSSTWKPELTTNPSWSFCQQDVDCREVPGTHCVRRMAVHTKHFPAALRWVKKTEPIMNCMMLKPYGDSKPKCLQHFCRF